MKTTHEIMDDDIIINPPLIGVTDDQALCPPTEVEAYMRWLVAYRDELRAFFGLDGVPPHDQEQPTIP